MTRTIIVSAPSAKRELRVMGFLVGLFAVILLVQVIRHTWLGVLPSMLGLLMGLGAGYVAALLIAKSRYRISMSFDDAVAAGADFLSQRSVAVTAGSNELLLATPSSSLRIVFEPNEYEMPKAILTSRLSEEELSGICTAVARSHPRIIGASVILMSLFLPASSIPIDAAELLAPQQIVTTAQTLLDGCEVAGNRLELDGRFVFLPASPPWCHAAPPLAQAPCVVTLDGASTVFFVDVGQQRVFDRINEQREHQRWVLTCCSVAYLLLLLALYWENHTRRQITLT